MIVSFYPEKHGLLFLFRTRAFIRTTIDRQAGGHMQGPAAWVRSKAAFVCVLILSLSLSHAYDSEVIVKYRSSIHYTRSRQLTIRFEAWSTTGSTSTRRRWWRRASSWPPSLALPQCCYSLRWKWRLELLYWRAPFAKSEGTLSLTLIKPFR